MRYHFATRCWLALAGALVLTIPVTGWGPHSEITTAAQNCLPDRVRLARYFGPHWSRLARDYVWGPDWQEGVRPDHYAEDHLLFPGHPVHLSHMHPVIRQTYAPFFRRSLQALRTESPGNAARWLGSLLHFIQDAGSPPHTTGIGGALHGKMERWVDEARIVLPDYRPRLLGKTDEEALAGFLARMDSLAAYSRARALKLRPLVEKLDRRSDQPLELECARECARASADVLHTLCTLGLSTPAIRGATLEGKLSYQPPGGYAAVPAKVLLAGTPFATTTEPDGSYRLHHLPPGRYTVWFLATGYETTRVASVELKAGTTRTLSPHLAPDPLPGNLVRNPRFRLEWVKPGQPDAWGRDPLRAGRWASAIVRVPVAKTCEVRIAFRKGRSAPVAIRWRSNPASTQGSREEPLKGTHAEVKPPPLVPFEKGVLYLEVLIEQRGPLTEVVDHVGVRFRTERDS